MDVFNRPPSVAEDTIAYELYPASAVATTKESVAALATVIRDWVDAQLPGHIWHRDAFELKVVQNRNVDPPNQWMLEGRMRVGDCVDDEWLVVWILREASRQWDIVVSVFDTDGEFLLIEAADSLPSWVTPTNAENRVWIHQAHLHLIPLSHLSPSSGKRPRSRYLTMRDSDDEAGEEETADYLSVMDALQLVRNADVRTIAETSVQQDAFRRVEGYPGLARQHVHTTRVHLPLDVARALIANPSLVQKATEAFYTRDALQLRAANRMSRFPPEPSTLVPVRMTRTAYAQLVGQTFYPPKPFGRWQEQQGSPEWRRKDVGMKIACGFEMLYQESKGRSQFSTHGLTTSAASDAAKLDALRRDVEYQKYIRHLVTVGYFQGQLEGSQLWSQLENRAALAFVESLRNDDASRPSFAALVNGALGAVNEESFAAAQANAQEDSDAWLNVDEADVDVIMEERSGTTRTRTTAVSVETMDTDGQNPAPGATEAQDPAVEAAANRLERLARKVEKFVDGKGDVEGALFEDERLADSDSGGESEIEFSDDHSDSEDSLDSAAAATARQTALDNLVPPLEAGEYGKMPASFYETSQRIAPSTLDDERVEGPSIADPSGNTEEVMDSAAHSQTESRPLRGPLLPRDKWDGVDSDDETDEEDIDELGPLPEEEHEGDEEDEDERPQIVGEFEIDMAEEQEEFLQFAREALGISDDMWQGIVQDRLDKGAYVPTGHRTSKTEAQQFSSSSSSSQATRIPDSRSGSLAADATAAAAPAGSPGSASPAKQATRRLDTFESVMDAMDEELARAKNLRDRRASSSSGPAGGNSSAPNRAASGVSKGKERAVEVEDIEAAMDAELHASLHAGQGEDGEEEALEPGDYGMIKNFLESFKAQGGLAGPVSSLAGRLEPGWRLPRDEK